jgi:hypothetical protein
MVISHHISRFLVALVVIAAGLAVSHQHAGFAAVPPNLRGPVVTGSATSSSNVLLYAFDGTRTLVGGGFFAFGHPRLAGVNVAIGDVDGNAAKDVVAGDGGNTDSTDIGLYGDVKVFNPDGSEIAHFAPYGATWHGAVNVGVAELTGDKVDEIITGPGPGGGPNVKVFQWNGSGFTEIASWFAYDPRFRGGVYVAGADGEVVTGAGAAGGPDVRVYSPTGESLFGPNAPKQIDMDGQRVAYPPAFTGGVRVGSGDFDNDGVDDIVTGAGPGGGPNVKTFNLNLVDEQSSFFAYDAAFRGGVYVAGLGIPGSGPDQIVTGAGSGGGPNVKVFTEQGSELTSFFAYDPRYLGGVTVAAARNPTTDRPKVGATTG